MAKKLFCTLPNASGNISGIAFEPHAGGGMITVDEISGEDAARFLKINGYKLVDVVSGNGGQEGNGLDNKDDGSEQASNESGDEGNDGVKEGVAPASQAGIVGKQKNTRK